MDVAGASRCFPAKWVKSKPSIPAQRLGHLRACGGRLRVDMDVVRGVIEKPVSTEALVESLEMLGIEGSLYLGYPLLQTPDSTSSLDAILVSPAFGLVVFDVVEGTVPQDRSAVRDEVYTQLVSRL